MGSEAKKIEEIEATPQVQGKLKLPTRTLGRTGLEVSPICFGSLRLTPQNGVYKETLYKALKGGIRFIDTSASYGNGASEILIGEVIKEFLSEEPQEKENIVLCTKIGLIQGTGLKEMEHNAFLGRSTPGLYKINEKTSYCLSPEFIGTQLSSSLVRLQADKVNVVLLQNPEHLLKLCKTKAEFMRAMRRAFEHLEVEVVKGRIGHYGISSSAFLKKEIAQDYLSIQELYELAESITKKHHFSVIQTPFNLFESEALFAKNQNRESVISKVREYNLGLMTVRPLTSHHRDKVHHFITFAGKDEVAIKGQLHSTLMSVIELEKTLMEKLPRHNELKWGHLLRQNLNSISDWWRWNMYLQKQILPSLHQCIERLPHDPEWNRWKIHYVNNTHTLFSLITDSLQGIANLRTNQICHYLNKSCEELKGESKLSNKVTRLYLAVPELHSIVMGLSAPEHVEDLLVMGDIPGNEQTLQIFQDIKMHF